MTKREFMKYNQEMYDIQNKRINPGDIVVINSNYRCCPIIGVVDHFTESHQVAITYDWIGHKDTVRKDWAYRSPDTIIKLRSGRKKKK